MPVCPSSNRRSAAASRAVFSGQRFPVAAGYIGLVQEPGWFLNNSITISFIYVAGTKEIERRIIRLAEADARDMANQTSGGDERICADNTLCAICARKI
jgi:hypothetical protein